MEKNLHISALLDVYGAFLGDKQRRLAEHYYNDDLSLSEIAENEGITRQGVNDGIKRAVKSLMAFESECRYAEKLERLRALLPQLEIGEKRAVAEITDIIENF